ncbi:MAG: hypothetical protein A2Z15_00255 [Chloroflexi bacterium RBG_16_50_11]|nr:MAG: hypothetical protein A2Z15_00255 [Chloroflexi bacterium RBG_16_50_11]
MVASILKKAICLGCLLALFSTVSWVTPVQAQGGFAMSGSFNAQKLELPQGTSLHTPDIYIVVFNNASEDLNVKITTNVPLGVKLVLDEYDFPLNANSQIKLEVGIEIGMEAIPGVYKIGIIAEPYKEGAEGIQIVGAAGQEADLTITGESGTVDVTAVSPDGVLVPAMIVLFREYEKNTFEIARTETGDLKLTVSPGDYTARVYIAGKELAKENFTVAIDEQKTLSMMVKTVYFEGFEIVPNYHKDSGNLVIVEAVCAVNNLLEAFSLVKVNLLVSKETHQDKITIINLSRLEQGKMELSYNYVPGDGWQQGLYSFQMELEVDGQIYTASPTKRLNIDETGKASSTEITDATVSEPSTPTSPADETASQINWPLLAGAVVIVGILIAIGIVVLARRRK